MIDPTAKNKRLQLLRQIGGSSDGSASPPSPPAPVTHRRRWGLVPCIPMSGCSRHRALPNVMFTTLRSRA